MLTEDTLAFSVTLGLLSRREQQDVPVLNYQQSDLIEERAFLLVTSKIIFLWLGQFTSSRDKDRAYGAAYTFMNKHQFAENSAPIEVLSGYEPPEFTCARLRSNPRTCSTQP